MPNATRLIIEYGKCGHPLGKALNQDDAEQLIEQLRSRLATDEQNLDLSPASLKRLEKLLINLSTSIELCESILEDEELASLIREIAAYVGQVLVLHTEGEWRVNEHLNRLWDTDIVIGQNLDISNGVKPFVNPFRLSMSLGNYAAATWDLILLGKDPGLYKMYQTTKRKLASQRRQIANSFENGQQQIPTNS
ncbi:MAG: hypothetical protein U0175_15395 [Caldilineaceae bacterium]